MKNITSDSIYNLLRSESFRKHPAMFLGKVSILSLDLFILGYREALFTHNIIEINNIFNDNKFNDFVANHYNKPAEIGWAKIIWFEYYGDELISFRNFIRLFDDFIGELKEDEYYQSLL